MKIVENRYKIIQKLGSGGMGDVYKVKDRQNNKIIALKLLSKKISSSEAVQRFKREFKLLTELHHPNLCEVYDFGTLKDGRSYFTMEFIDGEDIFQTTKGFSFPKIYPLVVQVCRALEYIHSKGLIHYDIKPSNILVTKPKDQRDKNKTPNDEPPTLYVKLMDFGLAGEHRIRGGVSVRGTVPYIAPEVLKGLAIDQRADLYSLGMLLYELLTRRPFKLTQGTKSFVSYLQEQLILIEGLASRIESDIPENLNELVMKLVAPEPTQRFVRANEVILGINRLTKANFSVETKETLESYLLSSRFVGREKEFEMLKDLYRKRMKSVAIERESSPHPSLSPSPCLIVVGGEPGIGKSRLLREFKVFVQFQRGRCLTGYGRPATNVSYQIYYNIFKELVSYIDDAGEIKIPLAVLARIFPDIVDGRFKRQLPRLSLLEPKKEKLRTYEALSEFFKFGCARLKDTVILLEDLHWADTSSIEFLEYLARNLSGTDILICATYRSQEEPSSLKRMLENVKDEEYFSGLELKPFDESSLSSFLDSTITRASNSPELIQYLMEQTGGNPFFVEELMRALIGEKKINIGKRIEPQLFKKLSFPKGITGILLKRLEGLDENSKSVVRYGSVLHKEFSFGLMKRLTGFNDTDLSRAFWELKRKQVLIEENHSYKFYHAKLKETIYKRLSQKEKMVLNYQVGKSLEEINRCNLEKVMEELAFYFINSKDHKKGIKYGLKAAKKRKERYANEQAIKFYKGVLGLLGRRDLKRRFDILENLGKLGMFTGAYDEVVKYYHQTLNLKIGTIDQRIEIYNGIGDAYEKKGEFRKAMEYYNKGLKSLSKVKGVKHKAFLKGKINARVGFIYTRMADYENAKIFNTNALKFLKNLKTEESIKEKNSIHNTFGIIDYYKGNYDAAIRHFERVYEYCKRTKDKNRMSTILNNLGTMYLMRGNLPRAIDYYQRSMEICEKIRSPDSASVALNNLGAACYGKGDYLKSSGYFQKATLISKKIGDKRGATISIFNLGSCSLMICDYKKAEEYYKESLNIGKVIKSRDDTATAIYGLGDVYQALDNYPLALKLYRKSLKIKKETGHQWGIATSLRSIASVFIELGEFSKARFYINKALKIAISIGLKEVEIECYILLCRINIIKKDYAIACNYYKKGMKLAKEANMKQQSLLFWLLLSEINYFEQKYSEGVEIANKAINSAREINTKDSYAEALLIRAKNEIKQDFLPKIKIAQSFKEAIKIAEEIKKPELLWKVYFEYGKILQQGQQCKEALEYYQKCIKIFIDVTEKIKAKRYKESYVNRSDRQELFTAIKGFETLLKSKIGS